MKVGERIYQTFLPVRPPDRVLPVRSLFGIPLTVSLYREDEDDFKFGEVSVSSLLRPGSTRQMEDETLGPTGTPGPGQGDREGTI